MMYSIWYSSDELYTWYANWMYMRCTWVQCAACPKRYIENSTLIDPCDAYGLKHHHHHHENESPKRCILNKYFENYSAANESMPIECFRCAIYTHEKLSTCTHMLNWETVHHFHWNAFNLIMNNAYIAIFYRHFCLLSRGIGAFFSRPFIREHFFFIFIFCRAIRWSG